MRFQAGWLRYDPNPGMEKRDVIAGIAFFWKSETSENKQPLWPCVVILKARLGFDEFPHEHDVKCRCAKQP